MNFHEFEHEQRFRELWNSVSIARKVPYSLFTFGESDLPYYLVVGASKSRDSVQVSQGNVKVTRPMLITPYNAGPEFQDFFDDDDEDLEDVVQFLLARTAAFSNLKIQNQSRSSELYSDSIEEVVGRLNERLDADEEDRIAILTAPAKLGKLAIFKYTTERIVESAAGNMQELRERGFLPD